MLKIFQWSLQIKESGTRYRTRFLVHLAYICLMKVYVCSKDGRVVLTGYSSLKDMCTLAGVSYTSALKGKRVWEVNGEAVKIWEIAVKKISGRGRSF